MAGLFVTQPDDITWQHYLLVVYTMITGKGKQAPYHPLAILFQQLVMGLFTTSTNAPRPSIWAYLQ